MDNSNNRVRLEKVSIERLFGLYDHEIELKHKERVTILHGPNGVGKSVLLRLIAAFFAGNFQEFARTPFRGFVLGLSDQTVVRIRGSEEQNSVPLKELLVDIAVAGQPTAHFELPVMFSAERAAALIERDSPFLSRMEEGQYFDHRTGRMITPDEVVIRYGAPGDSNSAFALVGEKEPDLLKEIRSRVSIQLVETQRLLRTPTERAARTDRKQMIATVRTYSDEIVRQMDRTLSRYATESQKLDQTFPQRLINSSISSLSTEQLKERLNKLDEQHNSLNTLGLIDKVSYPASASQIDALDDVKRGVMALYVEDTERKLRFLDDLATRIQLLLASLNGKFRNKTLTVSRERGLQVRDSRWQPVSLEALSSGEQHELVLWFDLLFKVSTNTVVLIDEPELSLHVTWQKKFLPELLEIAQRVPFDAILATHSPYIIGDRLDLTVPLDADVDE